MLFAHVLVILITIYAFYRIKNRRKFELSKQFPGPFSLPIVGSVFLMVGQKPESM